MRRLNFACNKVGVHTSTDSGKQSEFRDVPIISRALLILNSQPGHALWAVKALAIFRGCAGSSEPSLLA